MGSLNKDRSIMAAHSDWELSSATRTADPANDLGFDLFNQSINQVELESCQFCDGLFFSHLYWGMLTKLPL